MTTSADNLDPSYLRDLSEAMPAPDFRAFVERHGRYTRTQLGELKALEERGDRQALQSAAHKLISTLGTLGLARCSALARKISDACKTGQGDTAALMAELSE